VDHVVRELDDPLRYPPPVDEEDDDERPLPQREPPKLPPVF
jgi:hypothetical protein